MVNRLYLIIIYLEFGSENINISDMSVFNAGKMLYRSFGNSGLKVSVISLGNMINSREENY